MEIMGLILLVALYKYLDTPASEEAIVIEYIEDRQALSPKEEVVTSA